VVQEFGGEARFVVENYGESELAKKFGVKRYPAIFVNEVLVATPKDFGFYGSGEGGGEGRYAPLRSAASHAKFRADLSRVISLMLAGNTAEASRLAAPADSGEIPALPDLSYTDLDGATIAPADLAGKIVIVDFWATWCPPCRGALTWLGEMKKTHGDRLVVLALALESEEADVRRLAGTLNVPVRWIMRTPAMLRAFGDVSAVPTMMIFGPDGKTAGAFYGSTPEQHAAAEAKLQELLTRRY
jgi:thiol-disulfide isomerase/thioredoxin